MRWIAPLLLVAACSSGGQTAAPSSTTTSTSTSTTTTVVTTTTPAPPKGTDRPPTPTSAREVAGMLGDAFELVGKPDAGDEVVRYWGHAEQVALRTLAAHPEWDAEVLAQFGEPLVQRIRDDVEAGRQLRSLVKTPKPDLPDWHIVEPAPADELQRYYEEGEARFGVPWQYLAAVHLTETRMGRLRGTSTAGARGPMQFLPSTWDAYGMGGDIESNRDAILGAANYLKANGAPARMADALYRYNPTPKYVKAVTLYAENMRRDPTAYRAYWAWQVYYWHTSGDLWLPVGWTRP